VASDSQSKINLGNGSAFSLLSSRSSIAILLNPKADTGTHFTIPWRVEGWIDLGTAVRLYSPCQAVCHSDCCGGHRCLHEVRSCISHQATETDVFCPYVRTVSMFTTCFCPSHPFHPLRMSFPVANIVWLERSILHNTGCCVVKRWLKLHELNLLKHQYSNTLSLPFWVPNSPWNFEIRPWGNSPHDWKPLAYMVFQMLRKQVDTTWTFLYRALNADRSFHYFWLVWIVCNGES